MFNAVAFTCKMKIKISKENLKNNEVGPAIWFFFIQKIEQDILNVCTSSAACDKVQYLRIYVLISKFPHYELLPFITNSL